jgi:hypothetical protein
VTSSAQYRISELHVGDGKGRPFLHEASTLMTKLMFTSRRLVFFSSFFTNIGYHSKISKADLNQHNPYLQTISHVSLHISHLLSLDGELELTVVQTKQPHAHATNMKLNVSVLAMATGASAAVVRDTGW